MNMVVKNFKELWYKIMEYRVILGEKSSTYQNTRKAMDELILNATEKELEQMACTGIMHMTYERALQSLQIRQANLQKEKTIVH
jgi:hypothetical protein